jgi:hypothetical protein
MADTNFANPAVFTEQSSSATPPANTVALYPKTDGRFYGKDDAGTEFAFGTLGGTLGTVDNAVPRADGTGQYTAQGSDIVIDDATTSTQANVAITNQHAGQTNSALVLSPKGTGALLANKPNGAASGGNARGTYAVDLQMVRNAATQVASGASAFIGGGERNTATGNYPVCVGGSNNTSSNTGNVVVGGLNNSATAANAMILGGDGNLANGFGAVAIGWDSNTASGAGALAFGSRAVADRSGMMSHANFRFAANGDAQRARFVLRCKTTTNTGVEMALDGSTTYLGIPSGKIIACTINITGTKSDGSAVAHYLRQYCVKNVGGTSSEVYAPVTIGTDNAAGTTIALSANNTDDTLRILVTGVASETWRWVASVDAVEVAYGT